MEPPQGGLHPSTPPARPASPRPDPELPLEVARLPASAAQPPAPRETDPWARFLAAAAAPPAEFGLMPFWFWNDDLDEAELLRQLRAFAAAGLGGVVLHPRIGLSHRIGYLTPEYFRLVRRVVETCADLGLKVILYDEGSYPSGSACGQVVAENPDYAARALILAQQALRGPHRGYWRPSAGRTLQQRLVCAVLARTAAGRIDPDSLELLEPEEGGLVRLDLGPGDWQVMACIEVPSGGTIRGVFPEHEDGAATAPPAADLMNPAAVAAFLRRTHDAYAAHLSDHLGATVIALFTDEPSPLGRGARRQAQPYTPDFEAWWAGQLGRGDVRAWLPALWLDYGPATAAFRQAYAGGIHRRIREVFYAAQSRWCARHGIALTGHPADSDDMASLADFHWPGQDMVWRWVLPGDGSGLQGRHSVAPKAATSAARAAGRRRAVSELFGAYGWRLSLGEAKWLLDWHLARGNNLLLPHACFYSVRGGRAFESEPDIGLHNPWWPCFAHLARYARRMSWLLTDAEQVCPVAVVGPGAALPWEAARRLYEAQVDFLYVDDAALQGADVEGDRLRVGDQAYRALVLDGPGPLSPPAAARLQAFLDAGGHVLPAEPLDGLPDRLRAVLPPDAGVTPAAPDLRVLHVRRQGLDVYAVFNEGEAPISGSLWVSAAGGPEAAPRAAEWWDPLRDGREPAAVEGDGYRLRLPPRESRLLLVDPSLPRDAPAAGPEMGPELVDLPGPWGVTDPEGRGVPDLSLGDWTRQRALERLGGTLVYTTRLRLPAPPARAVLDLGAVGEAAAVRVNGQPAGFALWAPYLVACPPGLWRSGPNDIEVQVTNSAANAYEGALRPSGLMGPVRLRVWWG